MHGSSSCHLAKAKMCARRRYGNTIHDQQKRVRLPYEEREHPASKPRGCISSSSRLLAWENNSAYIRYRHRHPYIPTSCVSRIAKVPPFHLFFRPYQAGTFRKEALPSRTIFPRQKSAPVPDVRRRATTAFPCLTSGRQLQSFGLQGYVDDSEEQPIGF